MINGRGWVVVFLFSAVSLAAGWAQANRMWRDDWTRMQVSSVGILCKGDKYAHQ